MAKIPEREGPYGENERVAEQVELLLPLLHSSYDEAVNSGMAQLSRLGEPAVPYLTEVVKERGQYSYWPRVVRVLGMIASPTAVPALARLLAELAREHRAQGYGGQEQDERIRAILNALDKIDPDGALAAILRHLASLDGKTAANALSWFGDDALPRVVDLLSVGGRPSHIAAEVIAEEGRAYTGVAGRAVPALVKLLKSGDSGAEKAALRALPAVAGNASAPHLIDFVRSKPRRPENADLRKTAYGALKRVGDVSLVPALLREAGAGDSIAEEVIASFGRGAMPALLDSVKNGEPSVREVASRLILQVGGQ